MQLTGFLITLTALLAVCAQAQSHYLDPRWLFIEPSAVREPSHQTKEAVRRVYLSLEENNRRQGKDGEGSAEKHHREGVRKKQWHNYPRRLDKLERLKRDLERRAPFEADLPIEADSSAESDRPIEADLAIEDGSLRNLETYPMGDDTSPTLMLKIRLSFLHEAGNEQKVKRNRYDEDTRFEAKQNAPEYTVLKSAPEYPLWESVPKFPVLESEYKMPAFDVNEDTKTIYITRGRLPSRPFNHGVLSIRDGKLKRTGRSKRIFSFLTRVQGMQHARDEHRRHYHSNGFYPMLDRDGDIVSAETRALMRPPGSPLRWG